MDDGELAAAMRFLELSTGDLAALLECTPTNVRYRLAGSRPVPAHVGRELDLYKRLSIDERRLILERRRAARRGRPRGAGPGRPRRRPVPPSRGNPERPDEGS